MQEKWRNRNISGPSKGKRDRGIDDGKAVSLPFNHAHCAGKNLDYTSTPCRDGRSDGYPREGGLKWDNMMTEPPITPKFMGPHGVELPLYSISHELAWLMTVTSKAQDDRADFNNFYAHLAALFHQWHSKLVSDAFQDDPNKDVARKNLPFMVSIAIYEQESSGALPLILVGASNPGNQKRKEKIREKMITSLEEMGLSQPAAVSDDDGIQHYGNCAETWQWIIAKYAPSEHSKTIYCVHEFLLNVVGN